MLECEDLVAEGEVHKEALEEDLLESIERTMTEINLELTSANLQEERVRARQFCV